MLSPSPPESFLISILLSSFLAGDFAGVLAGDLAGVVAAGLTGDAAAGLAAPAPPAAAAGERVSLTGEGVAKEKAGRTVHKVFKHIHRYN